jgi:S-adenosylmethionine:tRNA ribosyltransferase-isomerase
MTERLRFELPLGLEASGPPEARGLTRDAVRMMVAHRNGLRIEHSTFALLPRYLEPDDLLVINTSGTMAAAITALDPVSRQCLVIHLSGHLQGDEWVVEPRLPTGSISGITGSTKRWPLDGPPLPRELRLGEDGAGMELTEPYLRSRRLWRARFRVPQPVESWLAVHGRPIRYGYVERPWPLSAYQNVYAVEPGSAEMPSAGRPFTPEIITRLVAKGVGVSPVVLHTGVASLEADELPYPERVRISEATARRVNATRQARGRVIAVGTTTVRALESAFDPVTGVVGPIDGWTDLVVGPDRAVRVVDGMLTGWHEPEASHLLMLEAIAGRPLLEASYTASLADGYLWHEFGDVHLILP